MACKFVQCTFKQCTPCPNSGHLPVKLNINFCTGKIIRIVFFSWHEKFYEELRYIVVTINQREGTIASFTPRDQRFRTFIFSVEQFFTTTKSLLGRRVRRACGLLAVMWIRSDPHYFRLPDLDPYQ